MNQKVTDLAGIRDILETMAALAGIKIDPENIFQRELRMEIAVNSKESCEIRVHYDDGAYLSFVRLNNLKPENRWFFHYRPIGGKERFERIEPECLKEAEKIFAKMHDEIITNAVAA
ncbi:hypothetical protein A2303_03860 [Candidatus Falkowbacteria bacterium RIFOXYB2_FULL_47_14]|uniref:Uncharacterized protein n=1 Tax=Candidatus Falkowbacteria bacterium RIFOXYA2_FULL_47_19 TaxID=1797994 RepID=A0A1F5SIC2_9BACT|nr:MAG: hypothetical protein A2227_03405 [Candidatus Falkowbacteria bacterium RIFOXYA2_FULL_47_19]OGF42532.1 MAG: hypothetical protein A2303_03860 [Candidatus Falkowbacteria bacterium RIFOXYB2_FULL_47_14]